MSDDLLREALHDAVRKVNANGGQTCVLFKFAGPDGVAEEVEFLANQAKLSGDRFEFSCGFERIDGRISELAGISAELLRA